MSVTLKSGPRISIAEASGQPWPSPERETEFQKADREMTANRAREAAKMDRFGHCVAMKMPCDQRAQAEEHFAARAEGREEKTIYRYFPGFGPD